MTREHRQGWKTEVTADSSGPYPFVPEHRMGLHQGTNAGGLIIVQGPKNRNTSREDLLMNITFVTKIVLKVLISITFRWGSVLIGKGVGGWGVMPPWGVLLSHVCQCRGRVYVGCVGLAVVGDVSRIWTVGPLGMPQGAAGRSFLTPRLVCFSSQGPPLRGRSLDRQSSPNRGLFTAACQHPL